MDVIKVTNGHLTESSAYPSAVWRLLAKTVAENNLNCQGKLIRITYPLRHGQPFREIKKAWQK